MSGLGEWREMLSVLPMSAAVIDGSFRLKEANGLFCEKSAGECRELSQLIHIEEISLLYDAVGRCKDPAIRENIELRMRGSDGRFHWNNVFVSRCSQKDEDYILLCIDWDRHKKIEEKMCHFDERSRLLEEVINEMPFEYDVEKQMFRVPQKYHMSGKVTDPDQKYMTFDEMLLDIYEEEKNKFRAFVRSASDVEMSGVIDYRMNISPVGKIPLYLWHRTIYRSFRDESGKIISIIGRSYDISSDRAVSEKLSEEIQLDPLTRIYNKAALERLIADFLEKEPKGCHAMFMIDIDNFKEINETFGHVVGDTVLNDVAQSIRGQFRPSDIVGRAGGDKFLVLMKNASRDAVEERADWICRQMRKNLIGDEAVLNLTLSVGIAFYNADGSDYKTLYEMANGAMHYTKQNKKNNYSFADKGEAAGYSRLRTIESIDADYNKTIKADKDFLNFAFSLLSHAKDINGSLNVLLEQVGKKFLVDVVSVIEVQENKEEGWMTNVWSSFGPTYSKNRLIQIPKSLREAKIGEFIDKIADENTNRLYMENWEEESVSLEHIAGIKFVYSGSHTGIFFIGILRKAELFAPKAVSTLRELARAVGVFATLRKQIYDDQRKIEHLQSQDNLTGIYNVEAFRKKVSDILKAAQKEAKSDSATVYAMAYIDINNFSYINENFGQRIGDGVLKNFAAQLARRENTVAACRLFSDHFVVLKAGKSREEICAFINRKNRQFEADLKKVYPAGTLWLSTGLCFIESYDETFDLLLESANLARKQAKAMKNQEVFIFSREMRLRSENEAWVIGKFYLSLQKGEIEMFLQPKFLLKEKKLYGAEALARWRLSSGKMMPPFQFITPLENMGYIVDLDFYIFEQLLHTMRRWQDAGKQLFTISTNFSRKHFADGGEKFIGRIRTIMEHFKDISPEYIEIEVTESVMMDDLDTLKSCLGRLEEMGFRIAIDDFGTGYSSLSVLMEIPAHVVKIDKSFTDRIHLEGQQAFVSGMGRFVHSVKEEVIFEGIEDEEQCAFLIDQGFDYGQGYLFDKPIPVMEFEQKYLS